MGNFIPWLASKPEFICMSGPTIHTSRLTFTGLVLYFYILGIFFYVRIQSPTYNE